MNKKISNTVIFDLDGTLIDSSLGILESFEGAFSSLNIELKSPLNSNIIGPPLYEILKDLSKISDKHTLDKLADEFKLYYDSVGYKKTLVFPGINNMLTDLRLLNITNIYIATNKRILPTSKILNYLNWGSLFDEIYALDSFSTPLDSKSKLISRILDDKKLKNECVIYVGDREDDKLAAKENNILFEMVSWGFDEKKQNHNSTQVSKPIELFNNIRNICD